MVTTRRAAAAAADGTGGTGTPPKSAPSTATKAPKTPKSPKATAKPLAKSPAAGGGKTSKARHQQYEFFGPHGPALLVLLLPATLYGLMYACNEHGCLKLWPRLEAPGWPKPTCFSWQALGVYLAWFFGLAALHTILPSRRARGVELPDKSRLVYRLNAYPLLVFTYMPALFLCFYTGHLNLSWLHDHCLELLTASVLCSSVLAVGLYVASFRRGALLSSHGTTGYPAYDFWMGRELNPRTGAFDWKEFCELYPGLIGWAIMNLGMAHKQYVTLGRVTNSMVLVNVFQLYYVFDALWNEPSILTTMDITTDGFGYMLAFGDLAWVPIVFTTSARYLADFPQDLSYVGVAAVLGMKLLGYWIFRGANSQKDTFRRNPNHPSVAHLRTLPTARGTKLIVSGWWGMARHINYMGDWLMGLAWCMPCGLTGLASVVPYFYCVYFAALLIHRERRDDAACRAKYGKDWDAYCKLVPYRIVPYIY